MAFPDQSPEAQMTTEFYDDTVSPTSGPSGDGDRDDAAVEKYAITTEGPHWEPEAWRKSPEQMEAEARAANMAAHASACANAVRHSNPPANSNLRDF